MPSWRSDLHVHTVLSACADTEMIPPLLIARCRDLGLDLVGVADHNSAGNSVATLEAAENSGITVKPGLEVETRESVHLLCLFDEARQALDMQALVYAHLPSLPPASGSRFFGEQFLVDASGAFLAHERRALIMATDLSASEVADAAHQRGGLVLAAHADRRAHGLLAVLGFVPPDLALDALECGPGGLVAGRVASSDAHRLNEVGSRYTVFDSESATVEHLRACLCAGRFRTGLAV
ncbi:MAG: PHP domain-containing protein [Armatimonadota bacterium]